MTKSLPAETKLLKKLVEFEKENVPTRSLSWLAIESGVDYCLAWWAILSLEIQDIVIVKRFGIGYAMRIELTDKGRQYYESQASQLELDFYDESPTV